MASNDMKPDGKRGRVDKLVGALMRRQYGPSLTELDELEPVPCNLCGADEEAAIASSAPKPEERSGPQGPGASVTMPSGSRG